MYMLVFLPLLFSCNSEKQYNSRQKYNAVITTGCPTDGSCEVKVIPNKTILPKIAESGSLYYELQDSKDKTVIVYSYARKVPKGVQDGTYREEIIFETAKDSRSLQLSDKALEQVQLLFGRICYCKGATGYYKIKKGNLKTTALAGGVEYNIDFSTDEVPQVLHQIRFTVNN